MSEYRKIVSIEGVGPCDDPGRAPEIIYPTLDQLVVNEEYQRGLSKASYRQIKRMAREWDWSSFKAPNIAKTDDPKVFEVIDGQHTAIAAASNGNIVIIPCLLVPAESLKQKAKSFLGINMAKIGLTSAAIYNAKLAAGDEVATTVQVALNAANCRLLAVPPQSGKYLIGDTMAVGTMGQIAKQKGGTRLKRLLTISKEAGGAPIPSMLLKALDLALPRDCDPAIAARVTQVLGGQGIGRLEIIARSRTPKGARAYETLADMISTMGRLDGTRLGVRKAA
jgi:hypothetical protein